MGILNWFRGKRSKPKDDEERSFDLAFVLLSDSRLPEPAEIVRHFNSFAASGESLQNETDHAKKGAEKPVLALQLGTGETGFVALMPAAVPNGEAENAAGFSLSSLRNGWKLPPHQAHLIVMLKDIPGTAPLVRLSRFTAVLAAVTKASPAVGIYWGNAGATHDPEFFMSVAADREVVAKLMLWNGVSIARESDGRLSLLTMGMKQLALPNLLLIAGKNSESIAMETMFDLLSYVAQRGEPIKEGETVGRTNEQRLPVRYVDSPLDDKTKVWRVELP